MNDPEHDRLRCQTSPGVQSRRYRLISIFEMRCHEPGPSLAMLEPVNPGPDIAVPWKLIEVNFLPRSWAEDKAYREHEDQPFTGPTPEPIEFEVTVRRVEPTPGFVDMAHEVEGVSPC